MTPRRDRPFGSTTFTTSKPPALWLGPSSRAPIDLRHCSAASKAASLTTVIIHLLGKESSLKAAVLTPPAYRRPSSSAGKSSWPELLRRGWSPGWSPELHVGDEGSPRTLRSSSCRPTSRDIYTKLSSARIRTANGRDGNKVA